MRMRIQTILVLVLILLIVFVKAYFVTQSVMPSYESFYGIRQIEQIRSTGVPLLSDDLSYQGRVHVAAGLFYYVLALFSFVVPVLILFKYGGIIVSAFALWLFYIIAKRLFANRWIAFLVTFLAALTPIIFVHSLNTLTPLSFFIVCYLGLVYYFISLKARRNVLLFVILLVVSTLVSSLVLVVIIGFLLYLLLLNLEYLKQKETEIETLSFAALFVFWYHLLIYKKLFFLYGTQAIWQNIPPALIIQAFQRVTMPVALSFVGILPLVLGLYGIYLELFEQRRRWLVLLVSQAFAFGVLIWLGFFQLQEGLFFITVNLVLLSGYSIKQAIRILNKTVLPNLKIGLAILFILIASLSFVPLLLYQGTLAAASPQTEDVQSLLALRTQSPEGSTVLGSVDEGHLISAIAKRKNFFDTNFVLAPQVEQRYLDARTIFLTQSTTSRLNLLEYYDINYIFVSKTTLDAYGVDSFPFMDEPDCFNPIISIEHTKVYKVTCKLGN